jgi:hypothetical protein
MEERNVHARRAVKASRADRPRFREAVAFSAVAEAGASFYLQLAADRSGRILRRVNVDVVGAGALLDRFDQ